MARWRALWYWNTGTGGAEAVNTTWIDYTGGLFTNPLAELWYDLGKDHMAPRVSNTWRLTGAEVYNDMNQGLHSEVTAGSVTGDVETPNTAFLVRKVGGPRKRRGRWFIPGVPTTQTDTNGFLTAGALTAFETSMAALMTAALAADLQIENFAPGDSFASNVTELVVDTRVASQRRRLRS